jgi:hypothetical protein
MYTEFESWVRSIARDEIVAARDLEPQRWEADPVFDSKGAAEYLKLARPTVHDLVCDGRLPGTARRDIGSCSGALSWTRSFSQGARGRKECPQISGFREVRVPGSYVRVTDGISNLRIVTGACRSRT